MILNENENAGMQKHFHVDISFFLVFKLEYKTTIFISVAAHFLFTFSIKIDFNIQKKFDFCKFSFSMK